MLTNAELSLPPNDLAQLLAGRLAQVSNDDKSVPRNVRDLAVLFALDSQVRNGGFAQYFFNQSCPQAFDAWFAAEAIAPPAHVLLGAALVRLGAEFAVNLDLANVIRTGGGKALGPAYAALLGIYEQQHEASGELFVRFASFRDRLAGARATAEGFDTLNMRFFRETSIPLAIAELVKASPKEFFP